MWRVTSLVDLAVVLLVVAAFLALYIWGPVL